MENRLTIGLFGFGCVGEGLYQVLNASQLLDARIKRIVVKDPAKKRSIPLSNFSYDKNEIIKDPTINVVVELINDTEEAYQIVSSALRLGKHVVTANKKLIAEHFEELRELAEENGVSLLYEAAVAGAIPIIRNLEEYYNNDSLTSIAGIVNGTTNYILTKGNHGVTYQDALKTAQDLGFAELNPTMDVDGYDARFKLSILIKHAFGTKVRPSTLQKIGIRNIKPNDLGYATEKGYRIKLIATAVRYEDQITGIVAPRFVKSESPLFQVDNEFNAITVEGLFADHQLFIGKGAGSYPTASAVLSDISALKFDYKYEYKKANSLNVPKYSDDVYVRIYLGSKFIETINEIPFIRVDEVFQSESYNYQVGWVQLSSLATFDFNNKPDISVILLPDEFVFSRQGIQIKHEQKSFVQEL